MKPANRKLLMAIIVPLAIGIVFTQRSLDPKLKELHKGEKNTFAGLSNEFILGPMLGLQEAVAGALWVRADEFFHEGDYDAILPIVRMVTWLDPHQLDVYITGAWHLAYNFTDQSERSDRRYIPASQALLQEGDENNPTVYDIAFEMGWENSDKIKNYDRAEEWFRKASTRKSADDYGVANKPVPMFVWHQLAHALERQGKIDECIAIWRKVLAQTEAQLTPNPGLQQKIMLRNVRDTERHNLEITLKRKYSRFVHRIDMATDAKQTKSIDPVTGKPDPINACISTGGPGEIVPAGQLRPPAIAQPYDVAFDSTVTVPEEKVLDIKGVFNIADGARVTVNLHDEDWTEKQLRVFSFDIDQSQTIMIDQISVNHVHWGRKIEMQKDPKMYSFTTITPEEAKHRHVKPRMFWYLVLEFNPRGTSPYIQDRIGWSGEGMTDKRYLWTIKSTVPGSPDINIIRKVYKLTRDQIMGRVPITEASVISNREYANAISQEQPDKDDAAN